MLLAANQSMRSGTNTRADLSFGMAEADVLGGTKCRRVGVRPMAPCAASKANAPIAPWSLRRTLISGMALVTAIKPLTAPA